MNEIKVAASCFEGVAKISGIFLNLGRRLRKDPFFVDIKNGVNFYRQENRGLFEQYLEGTTIGDGTVLCYWLDISIWDDRIELEASILRNKFSEQETVKILAEASHADLSELDKSLKILEPLMLDVDIKQYA